MNTLQSFMWMAWVVSTLVHELPPGATLNDTDTPLRIGATDDEPYNRFFSGLIDEVEVYDRALSASEIVAIYAAGSAGMCKPQTGTPNILVNGQFDPGGSFSLTNFTQIEMHTTFPNGHIFFTLDGSDPNSGFFYSGPFTVVQSVVIRTVAYSADYTQAA